MVRAGKILYTLTLLVILTGCGGKNNGNLASFIEDLKLSPERGAYVKDVAFVPSSDVKTSCGPASLATILGYYGDKISTDEIRGEIFRKTIKGTLALDLVLYARERGFTASFYRGGLFDMREKLRAGKPLILFLNLGHSRYPVGHFVVLKGFNDDLKVALINSANDEDRVVSYEKLLSGWAKTKYQTLLIEPKPKEIIR